MTGSHLLFVLPCAGLLLAAALHDLAARTIPNLVPVLLAAAGLSAHFFAGDALRAALAAAAVFVGAWLCWRAGWLGGGDVKLLAGGACILPVTHIPGFLAAVAIAGGLLGLVYVCARALARRGPLPPFSVPASLPRRAWRAELWRLRRGAPLPYGVAIAAAGVFALLHGGVP